ncbi:MAG: hypothetical protein CM1200mP20_12940 [Pseudomonadota bacterium]|nr:MAG: hypothetical protein CM1200mP20_12940 [Pseudomonadota bacterium]
MVTVGSVAEQVLYEIGIPGLCAAGRCLRFLGDPNRSVGADRVRISGALGYPPPHEYKVCVTYADGFRGGLLLTFNGFDARAKALVFAKASIDRAARRLTALICPNSRKPVPRSLAEFRRIALRPGKPRPTRKWYSRSRPVTQRLPVLRLC